MPPPSSSAASDRADHPSGGEGDPPGEPPSRRPAPAEGGDDGGATAPPDGVAAWEWFDQRPVGSKAAAIRVDLDELKRRLAAAPLPVSSSMERLVAVRVALLDDAAMDRLHRDHSGVAGTTDVLTYLDRRPDGAIEGDLALGIEVAAREAAARGRRLEEELLLYAIHGVLHLLGERDGDAAAAARMREAQDRLLAAIGAPPTERDARSAEASR